MLLRRLVPRVAAIAGRIAPLLIVTAVGATLLAPRAQAQGTVKKGDRNRITAEEIAQSGNFGTAFEVIQAARPVWLNPPLNRNAQSSMMGPLGTSGTSSTASEIVVYVDGNRQQSLEDLKTVRTALITEMRFLDQNRAIQMHGPGHELGVIEVTTVNKKK
jgi:hypothetical protein